MRSAFETKELTYIYPNQTKSVINSLCLTIADKESTALLGPNGAGKTTLLDLLMGWKTPHFGSITLYGTALSLYSKREMGKVVSLVPQKEISRFAFSVIEYVLFGRSVHLHQLATPSKDDLEIAYHCLERVGLEHIAYRKVTSLSGGEHQLLLLSRALAQKPQIILLDEPTSDLDPANTSKVITILQQLREEGITLLFTTHDPSIASECATDTIMLNRSGVLYRGKTKEVLTSKNLSELYQTPLKTFIHDERIVVIRES